MARSRVVVALLFVAGCDRVFGLQPLTATADATVEECPADYAPIGNSTSRYRFGATPTRWPFADVDCRADTQTAITHLVVFDDVAEIAAVRSAVPLEPPWSLLVGYARDTGSDPYVFRAVTGGVLDRTSPLWADGEPNGDPNSVPPAPEETVVYIAHATDLFDAPVDWITGPNPYFCECDGIRATEVFSVE